VIHHHRPDGSVFPREECPLLRVLGTGEMVQRDDDAYIRKDGTFFSVAYSSSPIFSDGVVTGSVLAFHDVTERKRAEAGMSLLVEASEALGTSLDYGTTLERLARISVPRLADICVVDVVEQGSEIRQVAVAAVDPRREELVRELERRYQTDPGNERSPVGRVLRTGEPVLLDDLDSDLSRVARNDEHLALLRRLRLVSGMILPLVARGQTIGALTFLAAESGRRYSGDDFSLASELAHRAALAVDNARLFRDAEERGHAARVLAAVGDGVFLVDDRDVVRYWNPAAETITGLSPAEAVGRPVVDVIPSWEELGRLVPVSSIPGAAARPETIPVELDGRELWLSIAGVGFSEGTVYAFRDLTEERKVETLKTEFVATASHELRTPLAAVYGSAMTLRRRDIVLDHELRERLLDVISEESDRLAHTINDILWASQLEGGRLELSSEAFDPLRLAEQVVEAARTHLPKGVVVRLVATGTVSQVAADADKARQVLTNLLDNAVKYSPDGGDVEIRLEARGRQLRFAVRDEGLGIPLAEQSRIFEKFYRLDPNLTRGVGGTGLGLYICRELVRHMGGRIWVASAEGEGSTFFFELPLAEDAADDA
jgi:PAS domain S-box-containing protein